MAGERQRDAVEVHLEAAELCPPRRVGVLAREQVRESRLLSLSGASYLDLALLIQDHGAPGAIEADLEQLFRRVVFNVMAGNRDDHLRNHAYLRTRGGWRLLTT